MGLRKELKQDIWKIIDGDEIPAKRKNKFRFLVLQLLLESQGFNLGEAYQMADELETRYNKIVDDFDNYLLDSNGDLLDILKNVDKDYDDKIKPLLKKLTQYREKNEMARTS